MKRSKRVRPRRIEKTVEQLAHEKDRRAARRNPIFKWIRAQESETKRRIDADVQLSKDFEFLVQETGITREALLNGLCWDCNMMHAAPQTVVSGIKSRTWPIDQQSLRKILRTISTVAKQIEKVNGSTLSPTQAIILVDRSGMPLGRRKAKSFLLEFGRLPDVLRSYHEELTNAVREAARIWPGQSERMRRLVHHGRQNSLCERIRLASVGNKYHANRLHRLVNVAREVQGLPKINQRSFVVWLNKLRKHATPEVAVYRIQPTSRNPSEVPLTTLKKGSSRPQKKIAAVN